MKDIDNQVAFWDKASETKTFSHPVDADLFQKWVKPEARILDYGCGYGRCCNDLNALGYGNCLGVDTSLNMIDRGRKQYPNIQLVHLTDPETNFEPGSMDVILLFAVLTCIPSNDGQSKLIKHLHDLLAPGGLIYVSDYWLQDDARNQERYKVRSKSDDMYGVFELSEGSVVRHHSKEWVKTLFDRFDLVHNQDHQFMSMNGNSSSCFQMIGRKNLGAA